MRIPLLLVFFTVFLFQLDRLEGNSEKRYGGRDSSGHDTTFIGNHHLPLSCEECHLGELSPYHLKCEQCHARKPSKRGVMCLRCHQKHDTRKMIPMKVAPGEVLSGCRRCHKAHQVPNHYGPHCGVCHTPNRWAVSGPLQQEVLICSTCHGKDEPYRHYLTNNCLLCHPFSWENTIFDHRGFETCEKCHERPKKHRPGRCTFCHDTVDWGHAS